MLSTEVEELSRGLLMCPDASTAASLGQPAATLDSDYTQCVAMIYPRYFILLELPPRRKQEPVSSGARRTREGKCATVCPTVMVVCVVDCARSGRPE